MSDLGPIVHSEWVLNCKFESPDTPVVLYRKTRHKTRLHAYVFMLLHGWVPATHRRLWQEVEYENDPGEVYDRDNYG